jgi:hypothetical protein
MQEILGADIRKCECIRMHDYCKKADNFKDDAPVVRRYTRALRKGKGRTEGLGQARSPVKSDIR